MVPAEDGGTGVSVQASRENPALVVAYGNLAAPTR